MTYERKFKTALVIEGGAMRGIFAAGVLDHFMEQDFTPFDYVVGVSAGAINAAAYLANQKGRNFEVFTKYSLYPEYINWKKFAKGGHLLDLDWLWDITMEKLPIRTDVLFSRGINFEIGLTLNGDGSPFFLEPNAENLSHIMKSSCTVPFFYRNFLRVNNQVVADGGVASPIPVKRAVEKGATKIMVIRSRPKGYRMKSGLENKLSGFLFRNHPGLMQAIKNRPQIYNASLNLIQDSSNEIQFIDVCPPASFSTKRFTQNYQVLLKDYELGRQMGERAIKNWNSI